MRRSTSADDEMEGEAVSKLYEEGATARGRQQAKSYPNVRSSARGFFSFDFLFLPSTFNLQIYMASPR